MRMMLKVHYGSICLQLTSIFVALLFVLSTMVVITFRDSFIWK